MKKQFYTLTLAIAISFFGMAQVHESPNEPHFCGQHSQQERFYEFNPEVRIQDSIDNISFEQDYQDYLATYDPSARSTYTIPVVVHVVHIGGEENIGVDQINSAIEKLNEDFNMGNSDLGNTIPAFTGVIGNGDFEFKLATKDPNGNCHSGITRTFSNTTYDEGMSGGGHDIVQAVAAEHGIWPQGRYMSVFVCIDPAGNAGYTYNPSNGFNSNLMYGAIFMRHDYMGVIGTGSVSNRHTLAHEAGHWLNLSHLWGSTNSPNVPANCNVDDGVADTPNTVGWQSCALNGTTCGSLDNVQNIMEYSGCSTMFTQGQAARMHTAINSNTAGRNNLITNANLVATGVVAPSTEVCTPEFMSSSKIICQGQSIDFNDVSVHAITGRTWTFSGGTPAISMDSAVTVLYDTPGDYTVVLEVSNSTGAETKVFTNYVKVLSTPGQSFPYSEGFDNFTSSNFPDNDAFAVVNPGNDNTWKINSSQSSTGTKCVYINNHTANTIDKDQLISGTIDLSVLAPTDDMEMTFDFAYNKRASGNNEKLRVYTSNDCGLTWSMKKLIQGVLLSNDVTNGPFSPSDDEWKTVTITNINQDFYVPEFRYMIQFESDFGNNIYIDNINITAPGFLSNENFENANQTVTLYPNPANNLSSLLVSGYEDENVQIALYDLMGRKIQDIYAGNIQSDAFSIDVDLQELSNGLYFVNVVGKGFKSETIKLIKE